MQEEMELVPSLTVFFSGCNARCCFCQNWDISQDSFSGIVLTGEEIGRGLDEYHELGVKNVNWVGGEPTPHIHTVISGLLNSKSSLPVVWNSNMYLSQEAMALLSGVVDIYLTDFKFGNDECAVRYSGLENYWETVTRNHISASQDAEILIRHLVLPNNLECCSIPILKWIAENLGPGTRVNVMGQYRPAGDTGRCEELQRRLRDPEISYILDSARGLGLDNIV
jgi:putative pyruvate formate lyase activating enzyme